MTGVRCNLSFPFPTFLIECLLSDSMNEEINSRIDSGTILDALNVRNIPKLRFARASDGVLEQFERLARPIRGRMEGAHAESHSLVSLRDALLPKLMSGAVLLKNAERIVARAI